MYKRMRAIMRRVRILTPAFWLKTYQGTSITLSRESCSYPHSNMVENLKS